MCKYLFTVREDTVLFEEDNTYIAYGIDIWEERENTRYCVKTISDVFLCREKAEKFVKFCNENDISLIHIDDIIEDMVFS